MQIPVLLDLPVGQRLNDRVTVPLYVKVNPRIMGKLHQQLNDVNSFMNFLENGDGEESECTQKEI